MATGRATGRIESVFCDLDNIGRLLADDIAALEDVPQLSGVRDALVGARQQVVRASEIRAGKEQRTIQTMHDMSVRREALVKFYKRSIDDFKGDLLERLLFIQCFAALDASEGHGLAGIYIDEFNRTLIEYQEAEER